MDTGRTPNEMEMNGKEYKLYTNAKEEKGPTVSDALSHNKQKSKASKESNDEKVHEFPVKLELESVDVNEKQLDLIPEVIEKKHKCIMTKGNDNKNGSEVIAESKDKKKKKKLKKDNMLDDDTYCDLESKNKGLANKVDESAQDKVQVEETIRQKKATVSMKLSGSKGESKVKSKKRSIEAAENEADECKKASKKRKGTVSDGNENQPGQEVALEESKPKKTKDLEEVTDVQPHITLPNGHAHPQNKKENFQVDHVAAQNISPKHTDEGSKENLNNGVDIFNHSKFPMKQHVGSAEDGAETGYGANSQKWVDEHSENTYRRFMDSLSSQGSTEGGEASDPGTQSVTQESPTDEIPRAGLELISRIQTLQAKLDGYKREEEFRLENLEKLSDLTRSFEKVQLEQQKHFEKVQLEQHKRIEEQHKLIEEQQKHIKLFLEPYVSMMNAMNYATYPPHTGMIHASCPPPTGMDHASYPPPTGMPHLQSPYQPPDGSLPSSCPPYAPRSDLQFDQSQPQPQPRNRQSQADDDDDDDVVNLQKN
ncbi:hypothetical protein ACJIZ3_021661 [Penstemon smallii]|uniref:Uncharacterized protein n=1 Tax=Penstemon smallii TaxID=265156 RepID=A0ABD3SM31_9LAMI